MRKYHRWLVIFFAPFLVWLAFTGVSMQVVDLFAAEEHEQAAPPRPAAQPAVQPSPAAKPKQPDLHHVLQHLHSGETFGPIGVLINALSGLALLFFAGSGVWMYYQMWRNRKTRDLAPRWFW